MQLRGRLSEKAHEVLPVIVATTVDLSRIDSSIVTQITSYVGTSRELLNLALTCKSFGWCWPTSASSWPLVEEVARQTLRSGATDGEMNSLPRYSSGTTTWLSILHRFEHLLQFSILLGGGIEHRNGDLSKVYATISTPHDLSLGTATSSNYVMRAGSHYARFTITGTPFIGIVRPMPGLDAGDYLEDFCFIGNEGYYSDFLAQRSAEWGDCKLHACEYFTGDGNMNCTSWDDEEEEYEDAVWGGMETCETGDTVGMLLNLVEGTLTVYKNNRRLGVMKSGLSGPYCWYATLGHGDTVAIDKASCNDK